MRTAIVIAIALVLAGGSGMPSAAGLATGAGQPRPIADLVPAIQKSAERFRESLRLAARLEDKQVRSRAGSLGDRLRDAARRLQPRDRSDNEGAGLALALLRSARDMHDFMDDHALTEASRRDWLNLVPLLNGLAEHFGEPPLDVVIEDIGAPPIH